MKILTFTSLFPNAEIPRHGVFVENRLRHLREHADITLKVVAPVPWFPFQSQLFGEYSRYARVPAHDIRHGVGIDHPRYVVVPKIGMNFTPRFMARAGIQAIRQLMDTGYDFDLIDAHYFYPDGVAAAMIAEQLHKPLVITARGTDLNLIPQYPRPRQMILWAANQADAIITVCQALKDVLVDMGVADSKVNVLRNGVDLEMFRPPANREALRASLKLDGQVLLSVGHLIRRKGHDLVIRALKYLPGMQLLIAGDGEELANLQKLVETEGVANRVTFLGAVPHDTLKDYYGAVDSLVLASSREGWANVLLESMACGTPVVATNIWGTPEVVASPEAGVLVERKSQAIADGVKKLLAQYPDRQLTRQYAEKFSWDDTSSGQIQLFKKVLQSGKQ